MSRHRAAVKGMPGIGSVHLEHRGSASSCCSSALLHPHIRYDTTIKLLNAAIRHIRGAKPEGIVQKGLTSMSFRTPSLRTPCSPVFPILSVEATSPVSPAYHPAGTQQQRAGTLAWLASSQVATWKRGERTAEQALLLGCSLSLLSILVLAVLDALDQSTRPTTAAQTLLLALQVVLQFPLCSITLPVLLYRACVPDDDDEEERDLRGRDGSSLEDGDMDEENASVPTGLSRDELKKLLRVEEAVSESTVVEAAGGDNCPICLESPGSLAMAILPCRHAFHRDCAASWLARCNSCPVCRACVMVVCQ